MQGSALAALNGAPHGEESIQELMQAVDSSIPAPQRATDLPFAMPIESVYNIQVRAHVNLSGACIAGVTPRVPYMHHTPI